MEKKKFNINLDDSAFTKEKTPVKPLFKPLAKVGDATTPSDASAQPPGQPLSYAEYIVHRNAALVSRAPSVLQRGEAGPSVEGGGDGGQNEEAGCSEVGKQEGNALASDSLNSEQPQTETLAVEEQETEGELLDKKSKENGASTVPKPSGISIVVSPRQRGNPVLKFVRNIPWEFGDVVPDYVLGQTTCALFLSLRYHNLNPNYIHDRLKQLGQTYTLRVLLVQVDVKDPHHALKDLARICIMADCTLILAWSPEEAGRYLETYKSYEKKPADLLKEHVEQDFLSKVTDCLTTVKSVNKTDALTLLSTFSSLEGIINASKEDLTVCPGLGPQKARRLYEVLHQPFLKSRKKSDT
ncbi:ERCC1 protein, partial [Amia calva]|nr:ERCC1 protein [Amia calva]